MIRLYSIFVILGVMCLTAGSVCAADIRGLYAYETSIGIKNGAVFGVLPAVDAGDSLVSASSPVCDHIEIHEMKEIDGIMQMRKVSSIPAPSTLEPQGYHLMLMALKSPLKNGDVISLTLSYKNSGHKKIDVPVLSRKISQGK